jgi:hypothetical protein
MGDCSEAARWIYLVDSDGSLVRFEPDALRFTNIGVLDCAAGALDNRVVGAGVSTCAPVELI